MRAGLRAIESAEWTGMRYYLVWTEVLEFCSGDICQDRDNQRKSRQGTN